MSDGTFVYPSLTQRATCSIVHEIDSNTSTDNAPPTTIPKETHHNTHTQRAHRSEDALCYHARLTCCDSSHGTLAVKSEKPPGNVILQLICAKVTMQHTSHTQKEEGCPLSTQIRTCIRETRGHRTVHVCPLALVQPELSTLQLFEHPASDQYHEPCSTYSQRTPSNIDRCYLGTRSAASMATFVRQAFFPSVAHERGNSLWRSRTAANAARGRGRIHVFTSLP